MKSLRLSSPAKLNLYLKILSKRPDGFHNIKTLFQRINLCDELSFQPDDSGKIRISCDHPKVPTGSKNLVYKVARQLQELKPVSLGVKIDIQKNIPVAAGLAGGSSNAATALIGLNRVWKLGLSRRELLNIARKIGSDVAFFLHDTAWALGTEKGDKIRKLDIPKKLYFVLVTPCVSLYSWKVYGAFKMQLTKPGDDANILIRNLKQGNILEVGQLLKNDLEAAAIHLCPRLRPLKKKIQSLGITGVMVSGSGPSIFGIAESEQKAQEARQQLLKRYKQVFVVRTL
ncbi:MAG: 4-(cytidine 5'-diphospho)-2-C-methyl-D-erythritol kinase [Candidatus Omnitrophica bacterium]|nr:4-(cytidine 5'-diphospho)-2-C-methyl-D-erythritol kinase [Candidatus Omnitrophota bacterium]